MIISYVMENLELVTHSPTHSSLEECYGATCGSAFGASNKTLASELCKKKCEEESVRQVCKIRNSSLTK